MCGIAGVFGENWIFGQLFQMYASQTHRGSDDDGFYFDPTGICGLSHNRLSIIDLSEAGRQPLESPDGRFQIVFNGEIYNYLELRRELESDFTFRTQTDTEVLLNAYQRWGASCLDRLFGMFAFIVWDTKTKTAFAARDRFGVKPLYFHQKPDGTLFLASEIKALHAAGISRQPNYQTWSTYLTSGLIDHSTETFWEGIYKLSAGHFLWWKEGRLIIKKWYDLADKVTDEIDNRSEAEVKEEYLELLKDSVRLRFRAHVPVGINLSGGVDSSTLLQLVHLLKKDESLVAAHTFVTNDDRYDELPWVRQMLERTKHPLVISTLMAQDVPELAVSVQQFQDEPFSGIPTLAYAKLFADAREKGTIVLLDGNGLDEQWAGYSYYQNLTNGYRSKIVQGTVEKSVRSECLTMEFRSLSKDFTYPEFFSDNLQNLQYRDINYTKIPRAMRFNDRISMRSSTELREPFLDHRLFELAFRQSADRKIKDGIGKKMLREIVKELLPEGVSQAPKRALQTPQREWLRGELRWWADDLIRTGLNQLGNGWFQKDEVISEWERYCRGESDNSFYIWQWVNIGLMSEKSDFMEEKFELHRNQSSIAG